MVFHNWISGVLHKARVINGHRKDTQSVEHTESSEAKPHIQRGWIYNKGAPGEQWVTMVLLINGATSKRPPYGKKERLVLYFILYTTTNFKWIAVLSVKENVVKLLEDHVQEHICYGSDLS